MRNVLVVGGTGPSGVPLVNAFLADGDDVTIFHSGEHEAEFDGPVTHFHGDSRDAASIAEQLGSREWDIAVCTSGRLRTLAQHLAGKAARLVGITGQPVYEGSNRRTPEGTIPLPVAEDAARPGETDSYGGRIAVGENQLLEQHANGDFEVAIVRYPGVFGPRATINHEWPVIRRILDGRPFMLLPHDGITYFQRAYIDNAAHLVYLAATRPEAAGEAFNCGDESVLSARHVAELIRDELKSEIELVGIPAQYARGVYPLAEKSNMVLDMSKARTLLGYRDLVEVEPATRVTARWFAEHGPDEAELRRSGHGVFDYEREDRILAAWTEARRPLDALED